MAEPDREPTVGPPRWVKVFGIIAIVLLLALVILLLVRPEGHGPGRHLPSGAGDRPPAPLLRR